MKKLLLILVLFISEKIFSQFVIVTSSRSLQNNAVLTLGSTTYTAGHIYVFFINTTRSGADPTDNPTVSSGALVLQKEGTIAGGNRRIIVYTARPSSNVTTGITFTYAETQVLHLFAAYESNAQVGTKIYTSTGGTTGTDPSITLPSTSNSYTIGYFMNDANPFGGTAESGWTEDVDAGLGGPFGQYCVHRNATTDNTLVVTASSSNWIGIAIQFSGRRAVVIN